MNLLKRDLMEKLGSEIKFYIPKIKCQKIKKNKVFFSEHKILGDYLFLFHNKLKLRNDVMVISKLSDVSDNSRITYLVTRSVTKTKVIIIKLNKFFFIILLVTMSITRKCIYFPTNWTFISYSFLCFN